MTNRNEAIEKAEALEQRLAMQLIDAGKLWLALQDCVQPDAVAALNAALRGATELRIEITLGAMPVVRAVTLDGSGEEIALLRRLELAPAPSAAH